MGAVGACVLLAVAAGCAACALGALWVRLSFFRCAAFWASLAPPLLLACTTGLLPFSAYLTLVLFGPALWPSALAFLMHRQ